MTEAQFEGQRTLEERLALIEADLSASAALGHAGLTGAAGAQIKPDDQLGLGQGVANGLPDRVEEIRSVLLRQTDELRRFDESLAVPSSPDAVGAATVDMRQEVRVLQALARTTDALAELIGRLGTRPEFRPIQAPVSSANARVLALESQIEALEAVAAARQRVIDEQSKALDAYRRTRMRSRFRRRVSNFVSPRIGTLEQYSPRQMHIPSWYSDLPVLRHAPLISIVTPTLNQGRFIDRTLRSVLDQQYPELEYIVQDGASQDNTRAVLDHFRDSLAHTASEPDSGFADAINRGFTHANGEILAYLNSDDLLLPGSLQYVARFFEQHPDVDVIYGHRVVIDQDDGEIGRWILPAHSNEVLSWADYVPQETLFWRRSIWNTVGAQVDESFRFAIDWDLLLRFRSAGAKMVRLPRFLGAFRVHPGQKTSTDMQKHGFAEMDRLRERCHGRRVTTAEISESLRPYLQRHFVYHKLYRLGVLRY